VTDKDCFWVVDETPWSDPIWQTTCDNIFEFTNDGPDENEFKFCPYCGGKLKIGEIV